MKRLNTFELMKANYDINRELEKINNYIFSIDIFFRRNINGNIITNYTFASMIDDYLWDEWNYADTCLGVEEYYERVNADIDTMNDYSEENIINFLEASENLMYMYSSNDTKLFDEYKIECYADYDKLELLMREAKKHIGLISKKIKDKIVLYPKKPTLEKAVEIVKEEELQWELIRYARGLLNLSEKKKILTLLATELYIEKDSKLYTYEPLKIVLDDATFLLNNLHLRHNNKSGKHENVSVKHMNNAEIEKWCDVLYEKILVIILLKEQAKSIQELIDFKKRIAN